MSIQEQRMPVVEPGVHLGKSAFVFFNPFSGRDAVCMAIQKGEGIGVPHLYTAQLRLPVFIEGCPVTIHHIEDAVKIRGAAFEEQLTKFIVLYQSLPTDSEVREALASVFFNDLIRRIAEMVCTMWEVGQTF